MLQAYACQDGRLKRIATETSPEQMANALWIDLESPTPAEIAFVCRHTGLPVPNREDLVEIESSSRLTAEGEPAGAVLTLSMPLVHRTGEAAHGVPFGVVLSPDRLVTVRFAPSMVFDNFAAHPREPHEPRSADVLTGILEAIVDRQADALEQMRGQLDRMSHQIFHNKLDSQVPKPGTRRRREETELRDMLTALGRLYDMISVIRESQLGIGRIAPYVSSAATWIPKKMTARLKTVSQDVTSLNEFSVHLTDKVQFMLDAVLGLINISQNNLMKVFTVVSVIGIPPTLVAGIYGMNFANMPELHWKFGYFYGLSVILLTAILPLAWFRRKGWI